jgi:ATP-dependent helicase/nuclease subunit A
VLQHLDFARADTSSAIHSQVQDLVQSKLITDAQGRVVDVDAILWFAQSKLGNVLRDNHALLRREQTVYFATAPQDAIGKTLDIIDPQDSVMVRGRIDVLLPLDDGVIVIDYKTDRVKETELDARVELYRPQILSYGSAMAHIARRKLLGAHLVFLEPRVVRTVALDQEKSSL